VRLDGVKGGGMCGRLLDTTGETLTGTGTSGKKMKRVKGKSEYKD
jgi:hypothetical protein